jgi:hypothetical protein
VCKVYKAHCVLVSPLLSCAQSLRHEVKQHEATAGALQAEADTLRQRGVALGSVGTALADINDLLRALRQVGVASEGQSRDGLAEKVRAVAEENSRVSQQLAAARDASEFILVGEVLDSQLREAGVVVAEVARWTILYDQLDDMLAACQVSWPIIVVHNFI